MSTTRISIIIDESGSMSGNKKSVIDGVNEFKNSLLSGVKEGNEVFADLIFFDASYNEEIEDVRFKFEGTPLAELPELGDGDYTPRGGTPLNDAIIEGIEKLAAQSSEEDKNMVIIMTDGMENSSQNSTERVKEIVQAKESDGWNFVFLGANIDSFSTGTQYGMTAGKKMQFNSTQVGTASALRSVAALATNRANMDDEGYTSFAAAMSDTVEEEEINN